MSADQLLKLIQRQPISTDVYLIKVKASVACILESLSGCDTLDELCDIEGNREAILEFSVYVPKGISKERIIALFEDLGFVVE